MLRAGRFIPGIHCKRDWMGLGAHLDEYGEEKTSCSHQCSNNGSSRSQPVATSTTLSPPLIWRVHIEKGKDIVVPVYNKPPCNEDTWSSGDNLHAVWNLTSDIASRSAHLVPGKDLLSRVLCVPAFSVWKLRERETVLGPARSCSPIRQSSSPLPSHYTDNIAVLTNT